MPGLKKILIVGGVAGGASAAARARRLSEEATIVLIERGPNISFANCGLPYHIGGDIPDRNRLLVQTPEAMRRRFRIDVRVNTEALSIDRDGRRLRLRDLLSQTDYEETYDILILSPGAEPLRPPIPGVDLPGIFSLRSLEDMDGIQACLSETPRTHATVVGGGFIGVEMAEALRHRGLSVTLVEMAPQLLSQLDPEMAVPVQREMEKHGVQLRLGQAVNGFSRSEGKLWVQLTLGETLTSDLVILAIGIRPEVKLAREAGLVLGASGGIAVNEHMQTSDPAIYAVGDAVETPDVVGGQKLVVPLAGPANRQGRIAADNALGREQSVYRGTQGTSICKIFDLTAGSTGLNEKTLKRLGRAYEKIYVHPASHSGYYPGAHTLSLKLLFDPQDGKILGAQITGCDGVDKRLDVLATALGGRLTVYDLEHLELSYAPPYGSAKDPVNFAGFVAANALRGDVTYCHSETMRHPNAQQIILDVRTPKEFQAGAIPDALNIPVDHLRDRLTEIPREKELLIYCAVGLRSYLAARILTHHSWKTRVLTGGYTTYMAVQEAAPKPRQL